MANAKRKYINKTTYNRPRKSATYFKKSMPYHIFKDTRLDLTDIGLITWLLSNSKSYIVNKEHVMKRSGLPQNKFLSSWKKLMELGYIKKRLFRGGVEWIINEKPDGYEG